MSLLDPAPSGSEGSNRDAGDGADPWDGWLGRLPRAGEALGQSAEIGGRSPREPRWRGVSGAVPVERRHAPTAYRRRRSVETLPRALVPGNSLKRGARPKVSLRMEAT